MRASSLTTALAIGVSLVVATGAQAQVRTIGANLDRPANARYGCETLPTVGPFGNRIFLPSGVGTCTYVATGGLGAQTEVAQAPPGGGLVTRVRVRTGPTVGPLQVTVARALRGGAGFACCFYAGASQPFVPQPNAVTQVAVRLPMRSDFSAEAGETVDYLGLTVLAPGVPVPLHDTGAAGDISAPGALGFFPHLNPNDVTTGRVDGAGIGGVVPLLAADVIPFCGAGAALAAGRRSAVPAGAAQTGGRCTPLLAVAAGLGRVADGRVALRLICNAPVPCAGRLRLQSRRPAAASATRKARTRIYASTRVSIPSGGETRVRPKLTRAGRKLMKGRKRAGAWLNARLTHGSASATVSRRVKLRR